MDEKIVQIIEGIREEKRVHACDLCFDIMSPVVYSRIKVGDGDLRYGIAVKMLDRLGYKIEIVRK